MMGLGDQNTHARDVRDVSKMTSPAECLDITGSRDAGDVGDVVSKQSEKSVKGSHVFIFSGRFRERYRIWRTAFINFISITINRGKWQLNNRGPGLRPWPYRMMGSSRRYP